MARKVLHLQIFKPGAFGGTVNTTVCGRVRNGGDYNVADDVDSVTCTYCRRAIDTNAPRMKWVGWTPEN